WMVLDELRVHAGAPERSELGIEKLMRSVEARCIQYEKAAVLFNVASVLSQLACSQRLWTKDGKRSAAAYFQRSAGVLLHLRDSLTQRIQYKLDRSSDLSEETLAAAAQLMLAQAMECFVDKANEDKASSTVTSMIAAQTADFFEVALARSRSDLTLVSRSRFPKEWTNQMSAKYFAYMAIAHFHAPLSLGPEQALGERVARLALARDNITQAVKLVRESPGFFGKIVKGYAETIEASHVLADAVNFEKNLSTAVDRQLVLGLRRPPEALVAPASTSSVSGDLARFPDMFAGLSMRPHKLADGAVGDWDESEVAVLLAKKIVDAAKAEVAACGAEIDSTVAALRADRAASAAVHVSLRELVQENRRRGLELLARVHRLGTAEETIRCDELMEKLEDLSAWVIASFAEAKNILADADGLGDGRRLGLETELAKLSAELGRCQEGMNKVRSLFDGPVAEFDPLEWSEDRLRELIPGLGRTDRKAPEPLQAVEADERRAELIAENDELLGQLESLKC
ncbi:hypothetical protein HK405_012972, partial [Cladochytrium tenue]